jgi:ribosome-binding factor A
MNASMNMFLTTARHSARKIIVRCIHVQTKSNCITKHNIRRSIQQRESTASLSSTTTTTTSIKRYKPPNNPGLHSVKEQGIKILQSLTADIQSKTKRRLLLVDEDTGPTSTQLREAVRLKSLTEDALEQYTSHKGSLFCIMNEPIAIIDVEITEDLRQARVYWSLPYGVLLMDTKREARVKAVKRMQIILEERGGVLQGLVHAKLRSYYRPPKIRFVPAEGEMIRSVLKDLI